MNLKIKKVVGCGGIGKGLLFHSPNNETLGRSESRLVTISNAKDYCKQQIVFYYIAELLKGKCEVIPVGAVGDDNIGTELVDIMLRQGMDVRYIKQISGTSTMLSICLQYPDKEGCNFTAQNNAAEYVTPEFIEQALERIDINEECCLVAVPEVPIESRIRMLEIGKKKGAMCVLSVPISEADTFEKSDIYAKCDLIAVNEEEAQAMAKCEYQGERLASCLTKYLQRWNPDIKVCMTAGSRGAFCGEKDSLEFIPSYPAEAVNTTGAGDAFLGGVVSGLIMGLPFRKEENDKKFGDSTLCSATELATLCAGMAVECEDSIAENVTIESIKERINLHKWKQKLL